MGLDGNARIAREFESSENGTVLAIPKVGGFHHRYTDTMRSDHASTPVNASCIPLIAPLSDIPSHFTGFVPAVKSDASQSSHFSAIPLWFLSVPLSRMAFSGEILTSTITHDATSHVGITYKYLQFRVALFFFIDMNDRPAVKTTSVSLLQRLQATKPEESDWHRLQEIYLPLIRHWLGRIPDIGDNAADLTQEVLLVVIREVPRFERRREGSFRAWLRQVTVNKVSNPLETTTPSAARRTRSG